MDDSIDDADHIGENENALHEMKCMVWVFEIEMDSHGYKNFHK